MTAVEHLTLLDNTIVLFISDHGELLGDHWLIHKGPFLFNSLVRVPTIWRLPETANRGATCDGLISTVDLCPTLLDLLDVPAPDGMQGISYRKLLEGSGETIRDSVYIEFDASIFGERQRQLRTKEWALTWSAGKDYGMLFDLRSDPDELHNLWNDPQHAHIRNHLAATLLDEGLKADHWQPKRRVIA
jgi:arylsulfatase A-like enzyme